jgi:hypothetical protein
MKGVESIYMSGEMASKPAQPVKVLGRITVRNREVLARGNSLGHC